MADRLTNAQAHDLERHGYYVGARPTRRFLLRLWQVVVSLAFAAFMAASGIAVVIAGLLWLWRGMLSW